MRTQDRRAPAPAPTWDPADVVLPGGEQLLPARSSTAAARRRYLVSASPWTSADALRLMVLGAVGLVGVVACYYGASNETALRDQVRWVLGALVATAAFAGAGVAWLLAGFREVRRGINELAADRAMVFELPGPAAAPAEVAPTSDRTHGLVTADGMSRAHRQDCLLVRGKDVRPVTDADLDVLLPCGACHP